MLLDTIHFHGWQEFSVRKVRNTLCLPAYTNERFNIVVPGCYIPVADRPVDSVTINCISRKIQVAPPIAHARPKQRAPSNNIAADPIKSFYFSIGIFLVVDVERFVVAPVAV